MNRLKDVSLETCLISRCDLPVLNFFSPMPNPTLECTVYYLMKYLLQTIISFEIRELPLVASRGEQNVKMRLI